MFKIVQSFVDTVYDVFKTRCVMNLVFVILYLSDYYLRNHLLLTCCRSNKLFGVTSEILLSAAGHHVRGPRQKSGNVSGAAHTRGHVQVSAGIFHSVRRPNHRDGSLRHTSDMQLALMILVRKRISPTSHNCGHNVFP
jgi:hypothetical protein